MNKKLIFQNLQYNPRKRLFVFKCSMLMWLCCGFYAFATVDIRTTINSLQLGGASERGGMVIFRMISDDFPNASSSNPVYIRLQLTNNALLAETLVDVSTSPTGHNPINLVTVVKTNSGSVINIPSQSVSIARWRKGEKSIWLKISSSSSFWITRDGVPGPPTITEPVEIILGQTVEESKAIYSDDFNANRANFPAATRRNGIEVDTAILLDLRESNLQAAPAPDFLSLLSFDPLSLAGDTQGVESSTSEPINGSLTFPSYSGDVQLGRGVGVRMDRWFYHVPTDTGGFESEFILTNRISQNATVRLKAYDNRANVLVEESVVVPGASFRIIKKQDVFEELPVSHIQILGPDTCITGISYRASQEQSLTASSPENRKTTGFWEYFPETESFGFDGFALVNMGLGPAVLTVTFLNSEGLVIEEIELFTDQSFEPLFKELLLLSDITPAGANPAMVRFRSTQTLGVIALKGTLSGNGPRSLFPVPIFTTVFEN